MCYRYFSHALLVLGLSLATVVAQAGNVYKCKQADGSVTFTNIACPDDAVNKEYRGESAPRQSWEDSSQGRYSVTRQLQRMKQHSGIERSGRNSYRRYTNTISHNQSVQEKYSGNPDKAQQYYDEAAKVRSQSSMRRHMSKSKRKAMEDEAQGLERLGDAIAGRRPTAAKTDLELSREREEAANIRVKKYRQDALDAEMDIQNLEGEAIRVQQQENQRIIQENLWR